MNSLAQNQLKSNNQVQAHQSTTSSDFLKRLIEARQSGDTLSVVTIERGVTLEKAIQGTTIRNLIREIGDTTLLVALAGMILQTAGFFNIGKSITDEQALDTASLLIDSYPHETIEDFTLMFREAKKGKYGELYNRLDGQIIFKWMSAYLDMKAEHLEKIHCKTKNEGTQSDSTIRAVLSIDEGQIVQGRTVIDALKEGIGWDDGDKKEQDYLEYKKKYVRAKTEKIT